jgi:hypothetical protein
MRRTLRAHAPLLASDLRVPCDRGVLFRSGESNRQDDPRPVRKRQRVGRLCSRAGGRHRLQFVSHLQLRLVSTPAQSALVSWTMTCSESVGGVGQKSGQSTLGLSTIEDLALPAPSDSCIVAANAQLSGSGTRTVVLYNGNRVIRAGLVSCLGSIDGPAALPAS